MHTKRHFCGFLNQDNLFSIFPFAATRSFAWAKYILYPIKSMKMCLSLFKGTVGLVTLKKKLLEKSLNLANNPVEDTLVSVFLLQIQATADKIALMNYTARLHLDHWSISKVLPLIRWLPKSSFVKKKPVSQDSLFLCTVNYPRGCWWQPLPGNHKKQLQLSCYQWLVVMASRSHNLLQHLKDRGLHSHQD